MEMCVDPGHAFVFMIQLFRISETHFDAIFDINFRVTGQRMIEN